MCVQLPGPPEGYLLSVALIDALLSRGLGDDIVASVAKSLLCPAGPASTAFSPCLVQEAVLIKLLCTAGLRPTFASAIKKSICGESEVTPRHWLQQLLYFYMQAAL